MKDFNDTQALDNDDRIASGTLTVTDYEALVGAKSGGTITVSSYAELIGAKAAATITVTAFASLSGKTITIGAEVLTEGVDFTAETNNNTTATNIAAAIDALADVTSSANSAVVTVAAAAFGVAGNAITMATNATAGITLSEAHLIGGKAHGTITVGADVLVQGTDFTAETSNAVTATNIAAAIDALADYAASAALTVVTIEAAAIGAVYNVELSATWNDTADTAVTLSGSMLTGGLDQGTVTLGATTLTQGVGFTAETSNDVTATNIAAALDAIADYGAAAVGAVVTVTADGAGTAYNVAFSSNSSGVTIVTMSGGADYLYSDVFDYAKEKNPSITVTPEVTVLSGGGTVVAVVEVSQDKVDWIERYTFPTFSTTTSATKTLTRELNYARVRYTVTGTATVELKMMTSEFGGDDELSIDKVGGVALPTAGADNESNTRTDVPTSSRLWGFDGTNWDRLKAGITAVTATLTGWLNTLPWAIYNATPTVRTEGQGGPLQADVNGSLKMVEQNETPGGNSLTNRMNTEENWSATNITTATTTTVFSGAGTFGGLIFNKRIATGVVTMYDNTAASGTKLGTITEGAAILSDPPQQVNHNIVITTGLTIVTSQAEDITVLWRAN